MHRRRVKRASVRRILAAGVLPPALFGSAALLTAVKSAVAEQLPADLPVDVTAPACVAEGWNAENTGRPIQHAGMSRPNIQAMVAGVSNVYTAPPISPGATSGLTRFHPVSFLLRGREGQASTSRWCLNSVEP